jgi:hypothetical protein
MRSGKYFANRRFCFKDYKVIGERLMLHSILVSKILIKFTYVLSFCSLVFFGFLRGGGIYIRKNLYTIRPLKYLNMVLIDRGELKSNIPG